MASKAPSYSKQLILAIILFVFGSTAYWLEYSKKPKEEAKKAAEKKVFAISGAQIKRMEILGAKREEVGSKEAPYLLNVVLECRSLADKLCKSEDTSKWELVEPLKTRAEDSTVNSLVKNFGNLTTTDTIDLSTETAEKRDSLLRDYGLSEDKLADPKTRRIRLILEDGRTLTAYLGEKHPLSDGSFVLLGTGTSTPSANDKQKVFVAPDWQFAVFNQKTSYFRDKKLIGGNERDVTAFTVALSKKNPGAKITGTKDPTSGKWTLKSGATEIAADIDTVEGVLSGVNHLSAKDFAAERRDDALGKKALAGAKTIFDLTLQGKDGEKRLRLYEKVLPKAKDAPAGSTIYATVDGLDPVFEIERDQVDRLDLKLEDYRMKKLIAVMDRYGVDTMAVSVKGKKPWEITLKKKGTDWQTDQGKTIPKEKADQILDRLSSSIVKAFSGIPPTGDTLTLTLGTPEKPVGKDPAYAIEFWKKENRLFARDLRAAQSGAKKELIELAGDFASQLPWDEGFLK